MDDPRIVEFESAEAMFAYMEDQEAEANARAHPQQVSIGRGEYVLKPTPDFLIFGYLPEEREDGSTRPDLFARGYRTGKWFSEVVPAGEEGDAHVVTLWRIHKEEFDAAMAVEWETEVIVRTDWGRAMFARMKEEATTSSTGLVERQGDPTP